MTPFLQKLAHEIAAGYGNDPSKVCVVLPNRRAGLYLKTYLAAELGQASWSPQTYSIEDFIVNISGYHLIDPAGLLFEFYAVHREIAGGQAQDFESFAEWGQSLLDDFEEIDQYLVDPEKIFTYLNEARALNVWNLGEGPLTDHEKTYLEFYRSFLVYYRKLRERLTVKSSLYQGLAYRLTAENIAIIARGLQWDKIFFAGLNALSGSEETIIGHLLEAGRAEYILDADRYYTDDEKQEAGEFIRKYRQKWPADPIRWIEDDYRLDDKKISVYGIPMGMGQARKAGELVSMLASEEQKPDKTAVVLADEKLLLPLLYALPEEIGPVNVTMGYPLKYTHLYHLVFAIFGMQENLEKFRSIRPGSAEAFYVKDLLKVLSSPYLSMWRGKQPADPPEALVLGEMIRSGNRFFLFEEEIISRADGMDESFIAVLKKLVKPWKSPGEAISILQGIIGDLRDKIISPENEARPETELDIEYLFHFSKLFRRCQVLLEQYPFIHTTRELRSILFQLLDTARLPFFGEPLSGMQVMGVLETRAIDFENLVILSVNEGVLPSGKGQGSFIPFDVKLEFGLPTYRQKDSVFAYHFYRMLQRARNIYLLYDTEGDQMKGGEKSRFITQIAHELRKYNPSITYHEELLMPEPPSGSAASAIIIPKTSSSLDKLRKKAEKGFSPTALNSYVRCSLQFYYQELLGLSEEEEAGETMEARTMGTVVHEVLQRIYAPFTGKTVAAADLLEKAKLTEAYLEDAFRNHYPGGDVAHGKNHLIYRVSLYLVNQLIRTEAEYIRENEKEGNRLKILSLEEFLETEVSFQADGSTMQAKIRGKADRIDQLGDTVRVVDYKTGYVQPNDLKLDDYDQLTDDPDKSKAFQLLIYAFLYAKEHGLAGKTLATGNITLRKISEYFMPVTLPGGNTFNADTQDALENKLSGLLEEIFDPERPFIQTEEVGHCTYCAFRAICTR